jgi:hypothetical protein
MDIMKRGEERKKVFIGRKAGHKFEHMGLFYIKGWVACMACVRVLGVCRGKRPVAAIYCRVIGTASGCERRVATSLDLPWILEFAWRLKERISSDRACV